MENKQRCGWCLGHPLYEQYHDCEWGVPEHNDQRLFEFLTLEGAQAGLSWITVLKKRECYRRVMQEFDPVMIAGWGEPKILELMGEPGIIRNRRKLEATVQNARAFLRIQDRYGSFDRYVWRFVEGSPVQNSWTGLHEIPSQTPLAGSLSKELTKQGFSFVGPTICYSFMQAVGLVNDHLVSCFRYQELRFCPDL